MEIKKSRPGKVLVLGGSVLKHGWSSILLFLLGGGMIGFGLYLQSEPEWTLRPDLREYNRAVSAYEELLWGPLVSTEAMVVSIYPHVIETAGGFFEKAGSETSDKKLKSLAFYNHGTMVGRLAFFKEKYRGSMEWIQGELTQAVSKLREAIREDPWNEDAKFNLELLENVLVIQEKKKAGPGQGYSPGVVDQGY